MSEQEFPEGCELTYSAPGTEGVLKKVRPLQCYDQDDLELGRQVEYEHTQNEDVASQIAAGHLEEDPDYYKKLAKMERSSFRDTIDRIGKRLSVWRRQRKARNIATEQTVRENYGRWQEINSSVLRMEEHGDDSGLVAAETLQMREE